MPVKQAPLSALNIRPAMDMDTAGDIPDGGGITIEGMATEGTATEGTATEGITTEGHDITGAARL
jgi:hypothetical protein